MTTEEYQIGYSDGYEKGWNDAIDDGREKPSAIKELKAKVGAGKTATVTKEMIGAAHDVMLAKGDFVLSAALLEKIYQAMEAKKS